jgi:hypothetical protein
LETVSAPVDCDPEVPVQPDGETVQEVVFVDVQAMVAELPEVMVTELVAPFAVMLAVGEGEGGSGGRGVTFCTFTDTLADPRETDPGFMLWEERVRV